MGRTFNIYDRSSTSVVEDGVSQAPFLGSATWDKRYILEEARQKLGLPNSRKKKHNHSQLLCTTFEEPSFSPLVSEPDPSRVPPPREGSGSETRKYTGRISMLVATCFLLST